MYDYAKLLLFFTSFAQICEKRCMKTRRDKPDNTK